MVLEFIKHAEYVENGSLRNVHPEIRSAAVSMSRNRITEKNRIDDFLCNNLLAFCAFSALDYDGILIVTRILVGPPKECTIVYVYVTVFQSESKNRALD